MPVKKPVPRSQAKGPSQRAKAHRSTKGPKAKQSRKSATTAPEHSQPGSSTLKRKRRGPPSHSSNRDQDDSSIQNYTTLKPRIQRIPKETVTSKWEPLSEIAQARVRDLFFDVERPVIALYRQEKRRGEAQHAVNAVVRRLQQRLPRMPFPPQTKDLHLDYEGLLNSNNAMESKLTPAGHTIALLKAQIAKEDQALASERQQLARLEANAAAEDSLRKRRARTMHPLLQTRADETIAKTGQDRSLFDDNTSAESDTLTKQLLNSDLDDDLKPLVEQLYGHMESIKSNTAQVSGLSDAIARTRAAVGHALYARLGEAGRPPLMDGQSL
ncbi:hypothetical protein L228DRAFT_250428 [Xylona heveae TC161]|uniref:Kinetochore protein fta7 n=1 Tax=Xylona heveae (strain CBS 132557 / TC161) TaxID=1328760 RepID=A0A165A686_XYLHT|nr:hypothetical protein L228DRAFT_250428 [Xylona heveae TC161]KZF20007.1 hypothetical protein L228DRAFT_250428 [Xylona heveae TC161]